MVLTHEQVEILAGRKLAEFVKCTVSHWQFEDYGAAMVLEPYDGEELAPFPGITVTLTQNS